MRLRYNGVHPVTFILENIGTLEPGQEFDVSDELAPAFLARGDIQRVKVSKARRPAPLVDVASLPESTAADETAADTEPTL